MFSILHYWYKSFEIMRPSNLKLFGLVTLKRTHETYLLVGKYLGWLILLIVYALFHTPQSYFYVNIITYGIFFLQFFTAAACRPSLGLKNYSYFRSKAFLLIFYALILLIVGIFLGGTCFYIFRSGNIYQ